MKYIEHIIEPDTLLLSWQPGPSQGRFIVAELRRNGDDADLVYLCESEDYDKAKAAGLDKGEYPGFPATQHEHVGVLAAFVRRLPPRKRTDFDQFLAGIRLRPETAETISDFALLGYAGAKLPGDDFCIIHPFNTAEPPFELLLPVAGYSHYQESVPYAKIEQDMTVGFAFEPDNQFDQDAVRIIIPDMSEKTAGYVCRGLLPQFRRWMQEKLDIRGTVERKNGPDDRRLVFVFVEVRPHAS